MRRVQLIDQEFFFLAQIEEAAGQVEKVLNLGVGDAVASYVEKTETVSALTQLA